MDSGTIISCAKLTRFSQNHGKNVILLDGNTVAYRKESFADAVTISQNPVMPGEIFMVEIEETEPGWTGHMRFGLTQLQPTSPLPHYSLPDLANRNDSWICAITKNHNNLKHLMQRSVNLQTNSATSLALTNGVQRNNTATEDDNSKSINVSMPIDDNSNNQILDHTVQEEVEEVQEYVSCLANLTIGDKLKTSRGLIAKSDLSPTLRMGNLDSINLLPTDEGSKIGLIYIPQENGYAHMHYIINGEDQGVFNRMLPYKEAPLYAVVDVYGTTKQLRIVQLHGVTSLKSSCRAAILQLVGPERLDHLPLPPQILEYLLSVSV